MLELLKWLFEFSIKQSCRLVDRLCTYVRIGKNFLVFACMYGIITSNYVIVTTNLFSSSAGVCHTKELPALTFSEGDKRNG